MASKVLLESEQQFWDELQQIVSTPCDSENLIDNVLRAYLSLTVQYKDDYLNSALDISRCSFKLFSSSLFTAHGDYVRRQLLYGLLQEDDFKTLHLISSFLLFDGQQNEATFQMMNEEGSFPRLLDLLQRKDENEDDGGAGLHRLLMDLLYEMSRIQRVRIQDLVLVDDEFIKGLFGLIEDLFYDANDPYHYPVIRVLLVLNEQFMISAHDPVDESSNFLTNKVMKVLSVYGDFYKTFGENIILLINREAETSLQLLTLKLLYLIFTTPPTHEYFYTNDLHVLVDILIRNLLDLPEEASALRHTYLRVLYPLLAHTQLRQPPHYKRDELKRMLNILIRGQLSGQEIQHFEDVDDTTKRLVIRCATVDWLRDVEPAPEPRTASTSSSSSSDREAVSPTSLDQQGPSEAHRHHHHRKPSAIKRLGMHLEPASTSSLSVREVAAQHEKPGVITPSRTNLPPKPKIKPEPPKTRRWRGRRNTNPVEEREINVDKIPEESEHHHYPIPQQAQSNPTTRPITPIPIPTLGTPTPTDRRDSANSPTSSFSLAPPPPVVPALHIRRSASNPPPAVPPPRRSTTHPPVHVHDNQQGYTSDHSTNNNNTQQQQPRQKPEPPKARRWGRGRVQNQSQNSSAEMKDGDEQEQEPEPEPLTPTKPLEGDSRVSVEEAVQNVSIQ